MTAPPHDDLRVGEQVIEACESRDAAMLSDLLAPTARWLRYGELVAEGRDAADWIVADLRERESTLELVDIARLRQGLVVALFEGKERLPRGVVHSGSRFRSFEVDKGKLVRSDAFGYRKEVLARYGLTTQQVEGALIVRSDDDARLYHLDGPDERYEWRPYVGSEDGDHEHCGICWQKFTDKPGADAASEGYASTLSRYWLCPECLDEIRDHYAITVIGGPLAAK
jgi:hypothetical protein